MCSFALLGVFLSSQTARASDNELQVTLGPGYSTLPNIAEGLKGIGGGLELRYGFSALWSIGGGAYFGHHFGQVIEQEDEDPLVFGDTSVIGAWVGPRLNLDVFVVVPFFSVAPEVLVHNGETESDREETEFALRWSLGFDYRPERAWSAGFEVNYHSFLDAPIDFPVYITTLFRVSVHFDFDAL